MNSCIYAYMYLCMYVYMCICIWIYVTGKGEGACQVTFGPNIADAPHSLSA